MNRDRPRHPTRRELLEDVVDALIVYVDMGGLDGDEDLPEATGLREKLRRYREATR